MTTSMTRVIYILTILIITSYPYADVFAMEEVAYTNTSPVIDGIGSEPQWQISVWRPINHVLIGEALSANDFSGRYKLLWDTDALYALVEITDDVLFDQEADPLVSYWDDDCLEVFIDEDASGGEHLYNHNAFAYHIALDGNVVDIEGNHTDGRPKALLFNQHINSMRKAIKDRENTYVWELSIKLFNDKFDSRLSIDKFQQTLYPQKKIGFMLAYCDNDGSKHREHFINSIDIAPLKGDKNLGYKNASVFQPLILVR